MLAYLASLPTPLRDSMGEQLRMSVRGPHGSIAFDTVTRGSPQCCHLLFPENGIPLRQEQPDPLLFGQRLDALPDPERQAILQWAAGAAGPSASLIRGGPLAPEERAEAQALKSALTGLPSLRGEFLRVDEFRLSSPMPWGSTIQVGDLVSNHPCFLRSSSNDHYAKWAVGDYARSRHPHALVFYRIESATGGIPLWPAADIRANPCEVLFSSDACFRVQGIALARATGAHVFPSLRIGVQLEQAPPARQLKHLCTGKAVRL